ncbi:zf-DHHC-domain-containing protein [Cylindrobasidium torrendii FP15055 ss-10]|uniref:Palmitoyltransferase n=1 Tax=Cylindrobasidium torrendii FP15055 ss-10 TaxID=1314674 RepID=A0A0D7B8E2_9AGAR|nr:zf-DHHC-domain-containing protein [Cylindrobasidium torrendii FP15055 ss-10]
MICHAFTVRCFKRLERWADRITGAAGPFFIAFACAGIFTGLFAFQDVVAATLRWKLLSWPICLLVAANMVMHYWWACTVPPGFVGEDERPLSIRTGRYFDVTPATITTCSKCLSQRPERAHHCRICNRCVLKYDHHCPVRINACVGIHNERHFILFMTYFVLACGIFAVNGFDGVLLALGASYVYTGMDPWPYRIPQIAFILIYVLAAVLSLAVLSMLSYHLWMVMHAETSVESQDFHIYRKVAKRRGETFTNSYDLGKIRNLELFFNVGKGGYPYYTLLLPMRIPPYTDGRSWARRPGYRQHGGVREGEELTDDDGQDA